TLLNRLPLEIVAEIFSHCPPDFPRIDSLVVPPLTLALVCKTWHHLVTNTARLWSCFELALEGTGSSQWEDNEMKRILQLWLSRSGQSPLSFRIIYDSPGSALDLRSAEFFKILLPHAPRWQHFQFHGPGGGLALLPDQLSQTSLQALKSISFRLGKPWNADFNLSRFNIPWSQLSALDLQSDQDHVHSLGGCLTILSAAKQLTSCTLNANCRLGISRNTERVVLPWLKSLKLIIQGDDSAGVAETSLLSFLERLSMTDLRAFSLEWLVNRREDDTGSRWQAVHPRFTHFIHSSATSLKSLGLAYLPLRDHEIIGCLDGLPSLTSLDLKFALSSHEPGPITDDFLQHLTPRSPSALHGARRNAAECLPSLETLKLQCSEKYLNQAMLLSLVEGRADDKLRVFQIFTMKGLTKESRERIALLKGRGFDFSTLTLNVR
ncbi:hypothetical protein AN958_01247, partial [Leucoagaricus sp. SymC.cos]